VKSFYSLHDPTLLDQSCTSSPSFGTGVTMYSLLLSGILLSAFTL